MPGTTLKQEQLQVIPLLYRGRSCSNCRHCVVAAGGDSPWLNTQAVDPFDWLIRHPNRVAPKCAYGVKLPRKLVTTLDRCREARGIASICPTYESMVG
jgi:hypothetical protein